MNQSDPVTPKAQNEQSEVERARSIVLLRHPNAKVKENDYEGRSPEHRFCIGYGRWFACSAWCPTEDEAWLDAAKRHGFVATPEATLTPKASLTEQAVKIPEELLKQLTVRVNHDHQPDDSGMWIASVSVFKVLRIVLGKSADLEQQLADQMAANERMAAEKDQLSVELATLKAAGNAFAVAMDKVQPAIDGAFVMQHIHGMPYSGPTYGVELAALRALCGGTK